MFSQFESIVKNRLNHARKLKEEQGKGIIGYLCSYVPEEILYAAGFIPIRMFSNEEAPTLSDNYMQSYYCTFSRSILHQGLNGDIDFFDGLVSGYSCTTMRLAFDNLQMVLGLPFTRYVYVPGIIDSPEAKRYFYRELARLRKDMEDLSGRPISDTRLWEAIQVYDENRALTREILEGRKGKPPSISGKEAFLITISGMLTDKSLHNVMLKELRDNLPQRAKRRV